MQQCMMSSVDVLSIELQVYERLNDYELISISIARVSTHSVNALPSQALQD